VDSLQRGISANQEIRVVSAITTEVVREACQRHQLRGAEAIILGRALTAGCLLATLTKNDDERVRLQLSGDGPLGRMLVDARGNGDVRGCFGDRPQVVPDAIEVDGRTRVGHLVGQSGRMVVTRDLGLEQTYQGVVELATGEIDRDVERYLEESEQLPSLMACEVLLDGNEAVFRAGGILCQTFPEIGRHQLDALRENLHGPGFASLLARDGEPDDLMGFVLRGGAFKSMTGISLQFRCNCGRERALSVVSTLGADDLEQLAEEQEHTEVKCSYCGRGYLLGRDDLLDLAARLRREHN